MGGPLLKAQFFGKFASKSTFFGIQTGEWASIIEHGPVIEVLRYYQKTWGRRGFIFIGIQFIMQQLQLEILNKKKNW